jgi:hypothetical protein
MPFLIPIAVSAASAYAGSRASKSKSTSTSTPTLSPQFKPLQDLLLQQAMSRLQNPTSLQGYESQGLSGINKTFGLGDMALQARLRARGLGRSNIAGAADARLEGDRLGQISQFQNGLPLLQRDLQNQDLQFGQGLLGMGRGTTTTGTASSGGGAKGGLEDLASILGYFMGQGAFGGGKKGGGGGLPFGGGYLS